MISTAPPYEVLPLIIGGVLLLITVVTVIAGSLDAFEGSPRLDRVAQFTCGAFLLTAIVLGVIFGAVKPSIEGRAATMEWAQDRYGITLESDQAAALNAEEIVTLSDGTDVKLDKPSKDAEGYLLYRVDKTRDEMPRN
jgi:hypothetical protein